MGRGCLSFVQGCSIYILPGQQASATKDEEMNGLELSVLASIKGLLITDVQQVFIMSFCICQVQAASTHFQ